MAKDTLKTQDRKVLLHNGYTPLPLDGKRCLIKGWSRVEVDDDWLDTFNRRAGWENTGIRCDNVVAIDIDVDDWDLADKIDAAVATVTGANDFCRWAAPDSPRRLILFYSKAPGRKRRTGKYGGHMLEVLAGPGCQFAALGTHPGSGQPYEWDRALLNWPIDKLPRITDTQVTDILERTEAVLIATGLEQDSQAGGASGEASHDYCLTPDMQFEVLEPPRGLMTVAELVKEMPTGKTWKCNLTAIRPDSDSGAGSIALTHAGLMIHDFPADMTYFEALDLSELLPPELTKAPVASIFSPDGAERLRRLIQQYVLMYDGTVRPIDNPMLKWRFEGWARANSFKVGKAKGANLWQERAKTAHYAALLPNSRARLVQKGAYTVLNTYLPPVHVNAELGDAEIFYRFMAHLIPDEGQRSLVMDWIANKCQHPDHRMHGLVMVAHGVYGVGRGTLLQILGRLLGQEYCVETSLAHLTGVTGQAQYNDYLSQSLLVSIPEAFEEKPKQGRWQSRHLAYEQLKLVVDTTAQKVLIRRKGVDNTTEQLFASIFIATNHDDALAIPYGDRRLIVVENAGVPLSEVDDGEFADSVYAWLEKPANIAALYADLCERALSYNPFGPAPETGAKSRMISAAESGPDQAWQAMLADLTGDLLTPSQWRHYANGAALKYELDWPEPYNVDNALRAVLKGNSRPLWPDQPRKQLAVENVRTRPVVIRNFDKWHDGVAAADLRAELLKNGPVGGALLTLPTE